MAGGGAGDGPPGGGIISPSSHPRGDVPSTVDYNGETLTFGDYRRPSLAERALLTAGAFGAVGWKALARIRGTRRTWCKTAVAVAAPCLAWLVRSVFFYFYREIVLQPKLRSPESVAFPSSRFKEIDGLKVHYLREAPTADGAKVSPRCVLHMNHGFGASSSSWTSVISPLSGALGALAVAHDTPGFGLTARAGLWRAGKYSLYNNAAITGHLVREAGRELVGSADATARSGGPRYVLMGHSMGCITAATAALDPSLPPQETVLIIIAPALSMPSTPSARSVSAANWGRAPVNKAETGEAASEESLLRGGSEAAVRKNGGGYWRAGKRITGAVVGAPAVAVGTVRDAGVWFFNWCLLPLLYPVEVLGLRALVYRGNFWRSALRLAWCDKSRVDLDAINRYRWPSLVQHWDRGMAMFLLGRSQLGRGGPAGPSGLIQSIAAKAAQGMKVIVVQGEKDTVVPLAKAKAVADAIPEAKLVVLPECGHVPHEERPDDFLRLVLEQLSNATAGEEKANATGVGATFEQG